MRKIPSISGYVESSNPAHGGMYSIQHFVIKIVSGLLNILVLNTFLRSKCNNSESIPEVKMY